MKLNLKNFRCYADATFDFGEDGLTLISGGSGAGKSTLMLAIEFALFGVGAKLQTHGKRSCSVELEINKNFKIFRQKAPNRLVVNDIYEDAAGESIIKEHFGSSMLTCYIPQNIRKSFILMTPAERLEFLESLVTSGTDIQEIKSSTKALIKRLCDEHNESIGALKSTESMLSSMSKPSKPSFHSKYSIADQESIITKLSKRMAANLKVLEITTRETETLKKRRADTEILEKVLHEKTHRLLELEEQLVVETSDNDLYKGDEYLSSIKDAFRSAKAFSELALQHQTNKKTIEELVVSERQIVLQKMEKIKQTLWVDLPKQEATEQQGLWKEEMKRKSSKAMYEAELQRIKINDNIEALTNRFNELTFSVDKLKKDIELAEHPMFSCPGCDAHLRFTGNALVKSDNCEVVNVELLRNTLKVQKTELHRINGEMTSHAQNLARQKQLIEQIQAIGDVDETADQSYNEISEYISQNKNDEEAYNKLDNSLAETPRSVQILTKKNEEIYSKMKKEKEGDVTFLEKLISEQENLKIIHDSVFMKLKKTQEQISRAQAEISETKKRHISSWGSQMSISEISDLIISKEQEIESLKHTRTEDNRKMENYKISIDYCKQLETWTNFVKKRDVLAASEEDLRKRYASACTFKEKILEAESIAITGMIKTINTHAQVYLDHFFPDEPISVRLVAFKETKETTKPQINVEIDYKGIDHDLSMLSGGELSRVILAFTLALAEIHHTPFVLLDESTSSLDQELTSSVIEGLKENFGNKLVVVIAHQVIQGVFDRVVKI